MSIFPPLFLFDYERSRIDDKYLKVDDRLTITGRLTRLYMLNQIVYRMDLDLYLEASHS